MNSSQRRYRFVSFLIFGLAFAYELPVHSQSETSAPSTAPIEINGYFDFYFQQSAQAHANGSSGNVNVLEGRVFDRIHNQLTLNMVELSVKKKTGKIAFRLDAGFGEMVDSLAANGSSSPVGGVTAVNAGANEPTRHITQATITFTPTENLSISGGKFYTNLGIEVARAKDNWQYSRSIGYNYGIPFWHQGMAVGYAIIPTKMTATIYLLNAWDGRIATEANKSPTVALNLSVTPIASFIANYNYIGGNEQSASNSRRDVHEMNATYQINPVLAVAVDYVLGSEQNVSRVTAGPTSALVTWNALAFYAKAAFTDLYTLSARYEIFDDSNGWALSGLTSKPTLTDVVPAQTINAFTLTNTFNLGDGFETRLEFRTDRSTKSGYYKNENGAASDRQDSYTVALLYSF